VTPGFVDPHNGRLLVFQGRALLKTDHPLERMTTGTLDYLLSKDGGRTYYHTAPVIQTGEEYTEGHPLPGVFTGKNATQIGDLGSVPILTRAGEISCRYRSRRWGPTASTTIPAAATPTTIRPC
jgi:hypothetical protein